MLSVPVQRRSVLPTTSGPMTPCSVRQLYDRILNAPVNTITSPNNGPLWLTLVAAAAPPADEVPFLIGLRTRVNHSSTAMRICARRKQTCPAASASSGSIVMHEVETDGADRLTPVRIGASLLSPICLAWGRNLASDTGARTDHICPGPVAVQPGRRQCVTPRPGRSADRQALVHVRNPRCSSHHPENQSRARTFIRWK